MLVHGTARCKASAFLQRLVDIPCNLGEAFDVLEGMRAKRFRADAGIVDTGGEIDMNKTAGLTAGLAMIGLALGAAAAPFNPGDVSADARWVVHADFEQMRDSVLGARIMEKVGAEDGRAKFDALQAIFNFDPRTDIDSVTLYGAGEEKDDGVVILRGKLDADRLVTLVRANDAYAALSHDGRTIHSWVDEKKAARAESVGRDAPRSYGCALADGTVVVSEREGRLRSALDVLAGRGASLLAGSTLPAMPGVEQAALLIAAANTGQLKELNPRAATLQNTEALALAVSEADGVFHAVLDLTADSAEAAQQLSKIVDGMVGLALLNAGSDPGGARIARSVGLRVNGVALRVSLDIPVAELIQTIEERHATKSRNPGFGKTW